MFDWINKLYTAVKDIPLTSKKSGKIPDLDDKEAKG